MTQAQLRAELRRLIGNPLETEVPNDRLDTFLQGGLEALNRRISYTTADDTSITLATGTAQYSLPADVVGIIHVHVGTPVSAYLDRQSLDEWRNQEIDYLNSPQGVPSQFVHWQNQLLVWPPPASAANGATVTLRYINTPATIPTAGPSILPTQDHRVIVYHAAAVWKASHGDKDGADAFMNIFNDEAKRIREQVLERALGGKAA